MAKQTVELGDGPDLGISDNLYEGFSKVNSNTDELYSRVENLESSDSREEFIITMIPNTLTGNITPVSTPYDAYIITQVEGLPPIDSPLWVPGIIPTQITIPGWNTSYTYYLYIKLSTVVSQVGTEAIVFPIDTLAPTGTFEIVAGTDPKTQIKYTITASDTGVGVDTTNIKIMNVTTGLPLVASNVVVGTQTEISGLQSDYEYELEAWIPDNLGNTFITPSRSIKTNAAGTGGSFAFESIGIPAETHTEPTTPTTTNAFTTRILLNGRTDGNTKGISVGIWEHTTLNTDQIEDSTTWSPVNGLLSFPSGTDFVDLTIDITGVANPENKRFELYLHTPTAVAGDVPLLENNNAILIDLLGQGGVASGAYVENLNNRFVLDTDMTPQLTTGAAGENYVSTTYAAAGITDDNVLSPYAPTNVYHLASSTGTNLVSNSSYLSLAAKMEFDIEVPADGNYYTWVRMLATVTNNFTAYAGFDNAFDSVNHVLKMNPQTKDLWDYQPLCNSSTPDIPIAKFLTAGVHKFYIAHREQSTNIYFNQIKIVPVPETTYDPSAAGSGPNIDATDLLSAQGTVAEVTDDPDNPQSTVGAIPATSLQATLYPLNGDTDIAEVLTLSFSYEGATGLVFNGSQISVKADGGEISGKWYIPDIKIASAIFADNNNIPIKFPAGSTVVVTGSDIGSVIDPADGVRKEVVFGTWSFDIIDTGASSLIVDVDFQNHAVGDYTPTMRDADFHTLVVNGYSTDVSLYEVAEDPNSNRGNVLKINFPAGLQSEPGFIAKLDPDNTMIRFPVADERYPNSTDPIWDLTGNPPNVSEFQTREARRTAGIETALNTGYMQYDIKFSPNYRWNRGQKLMGMGSGDALISTHNGPAFGEGIYGQSWRFSYTTNAGYSFIPEGKAAFFYYLYSAAPNRVQIPVFMNLVRGDTYGDHYFPSHPNLNPAEIYYISRDKWIRIWYKVHLGTAIAVPNGGPSGNGMPSIDANRIESAYNSSSTMVSDGNVLNSGTVDVWIQEEDWPAPIKVVTWQENYRWTQYLKIDQITINARMNNNEELPIQDQYLMFDNIKVSDTDFGFPT